MQIKVKITDKYIYLYDKTLKILESKYIKNGRVDNVEKFIRYLRNIFLIWKAMTYSLSINQKASYWETTTRTNPSLMFSADGL